MRKPKRRFCASLLAILMIMGAAAGLGNAEETAVGPAAGDFILGDFSNPESGASIVNWTDGGSNYHKLSELTDEVSLRGDTSLKLGDQKKAVGNRNKRLFLSKTLTDLTVSKILDYDYLYIWVYSDVANGQPSKIILDANLGSYAQIDCPAADYVGWKLWKMDMGNLTESTFGVGDDADPDTSAVSFLFTCTGWSLPTYDNTALYIDSIWFSNTSHTVEEVPGFVPDKEYTAEDYLIGDFSIQGGANSFGGKIERDCTEITRLGKAYSLKSSYDLAGNPRIESPKNYVLGEILQRDYLYLWMYSTSANNQPMYVILFDAEAGGTYITHMVTVDWTGWKRIKIGKNDWNRAYALDSFTKTDPAGTDQKVPAQAEDRAYMWLSYSWGGNSMLEDTVHYFDSIWFSDADLDGNIMIQNFGESENTYLTRTFTARGASGRTNVYASTEGPLYGGREYSVEINPSADNYNGASVQLCYQSNSANGIPLKEEYKNKYLNLILYSDAANHQVYRINFDGKCADGTTTWRLAKNNLTVDWQGWKIVSLPLSSFSAQNGGSSIDEAWANAGTLTNVDLHFPDWGNGREAVTYREITDGETGTHVYDSQTNRYVPVSGGETGTHVIANTYHDGTWHWDNIGSKILSDTKLYADSVFLSDMDCSDIKVTAVDAATEDVSVKEYTAVFDAECSFKTGIDAYKDNITVMEDGQVVSPEKYHVYTEGDKLYVTFADDLAYSSEYEITLGAGELFDYGATAGTSLTFTTESQLPEQAYGTVTFAAATDGESRVVTEVFGSFASLSARAPIANTSDAQMHACVVVAVYDESGRLAGIFKGNDVTIAPDAYAYVSATVEGEFESCTAKAFVWDMSGGNIVPYFAAASLN